MALVGQDLIHADLHGSYRMLAISLFTRSLEVLLRGQPHAHLAEHRRRGGEVLLTVVELAGT